MPDSSVDLRTRVTAAFVSRARSAHLASRLYKGVFFALAAGIAGAMQFVSWSAGEHPTTAQLIGISATVVVLVASIVSVITERDSSAELAIAQQAITRTQELEDEVRETIELWPDIDRMIALYQATKVMRDVIEQATVAMAGDESALIATLLRLSARLIVVAAGFTLGDQWTVCFFRADQVVGDCRYELRMIAHDRTIPCDINAARVWPEGVGVAGVAFSNRQEMVIADLASNQVRAIFQPPQLVRPYDDDRYRSMVAVPISVEGLDRPWGIITATNDRVAHFNHDHSSGLKPEEAIRALADYAALAIAMVRNSDRATTARPVLI